MDRPCAGQSCENTTALARRESAKEKLWTSPLCGKDQSWGRNRYANSEAGSIILLHQWPADLADEPLPAAMFNVRYRR
jgi:hypothetical protein